MLKKLMVTTALTGLVIGAAVAEGTPPAPSSPSPPAAQSSPPATPPAKAPEMTSPAPSSTAAEKSGAAKFVNSQRSDQFLASKFKGTDVVGNDNEKIGDVSDILFDKSGKIEAYVVGVGGFLGIGEREVTIPLDQVQRGQDNRLTTSMTKEAIGNLPEYQEGGDWMAVGSGRTVGESVGPQP
jgi:sporulation protein YlmC with PRC-barrel domain